MDRVRAAGPLSDKVIARITGSGNLYGFKPVEACSMSVRYFVVLLFATAAMPQTGLPDSSPASAGGTATYQPITAKGRLGWFVADTVSPTNLLGSAIVAGWNTWFNSPVEYGPHWEGFGKRFGMNLAVLSTSNAMTASLGAIWGEDPRYHRAAAKPFKSRVGNVIKMTFVARNASGECMPAYSRFVAIPSASFLSNTWRAKTDATASQAVVRTSLGFLGRMAGNAFEEFWPDTKQHVFRKKPRK